MHIRIGGLHVRLFPACSKVRYSSIHNFPLIHDTSLHPELNAI